MPSPTIDAPVVTSGKSRGSRLWTSAGPTPASSESASKGLEDTPRCARLSSSDLERQERVRIVLIEADGQQVPPAFSHSAIAGAAAASACPPPGAYHEDLVGGEVLQPGTSSR